MARAASLGDRSALGLVLALALAIAAGLLVFVAVRSGGGDDGTPSTPPQTVAMADAVRVVEDIPAQTEITAEMVEVARIQRDAILPGAFTAVESVVGQTTRMPVYSGEQLTARKVVSDSESTVRSLSYIVPEGRRAMAITASKVATGGGLLKPGDRVDVVVLMDVKFEDVLVGRSYTETVTFTVAQNIEVLAVEQELQQRLSNEVIVSDGTLIEQPDIQPDASVVTLALTPLEAQAVLMSDGKGTIRLAVRGTGDNTIVDLDATTVLSLIDPELAELVRQIIEELIEENLTSQFAGLAE